MPKTTIAGSVDLSNQPASNGGVRATVADAFVNPQAPKARVGAQVADALGALGNTISQADSQRRAEKAKRQLDNVEATTAAIIEEKERGVIKQAQDSEIFLNQSLAARTAIARGIAKREADKSIADMNAQLAEDPGILSDSNRVEEFLNGFSVPLDGEDNFSLNQQSRQSHLMEQAFSQVRTQSNNIIQAENLAILSEDYASKVTMVIQAGGDIPANLAAMDADADTWGALSRPARNEATHQALIALATVNKDPSLLDLNLGTHFTNARMQIQRQQAKEGLESDIMQDIRNNAFKADLADKKQFEADQTEIIQRLDAGTLDLRDYSDRPNSFLFARQMLNQGNISKANSAKSSQILRAKMEKGLRNGDGSEFGINGALDRNSLTSVIAQMNLTTEDRARLIADIPTMEAVANDLASAVPQAAQREAQIGRQLELRLADLDASQGVDVAFLNNIKEEYVAEVQMTLRDLYDQSESGEVSLTAKNAAIKTVFDRYIQDITEFVVPDTFNSGQIRTKELEGAFDAQQGSETDDEQPDSDELTPEMKAFFGEDPPADVEGTEPSVELPFDQAELTNLREDVASDTAKPKIGEGAKKRAEARATKLAAADKAIQAAKDDPVSFYKNQLRILKGQKPPSHARKLHRERIAKVEEELHLATIVEEAGDDFDALYNNINGE